MTQQGISNQKGLSSRTKPKRKGLNGIRIKDDNGSGHAAEPNGQQPGPPAERRPYGPCS